MDILENKENILPRDLKKCNYLLLPSIWTQISLILSGNEFQHGYWIDRHFRLIKNDTCEEEKNKSFRWYSQWIYCPFLLLQRPRPTNHICLLQANNGPDLLTIKVYSRLITFNRFSVTNLGQIVLGCAWACTLRPLRVTSKERWLMCSSFPILHHIKERHFRRRPATEANYRLHISWVSEFSTSQRQVLL